MLSTEKVRDCLEAIGAIAHIRISDMIVDAYHKALKNDFDDKKLLAIFTIVVKKGKWVTTDTLIQMVTGRSEYDDWQIIMSVASGSAKTGIISGISELALIKATNKITHLGALRYLVDADSYQLSKLEKDWRENLFVPMSPNALPPALVEISFQLPVPAHKDPMTDDDFSARAAAMIRCIQDKKAISAAWIVIIDRFPPEKRREVYDYAAKHGFVVPEATKSKFYQRSIDTARAVTTIDESTILAGIRS